MRLPVGDFDEDLALAGSCFGLLLGLDGLEAAEGREDDGPHLLGWLFGRLFLVGVVLLLLLGHFFLLLFRLLGRRLYQAFLLFRHFRVRNTTKVRRILVAGCVDFGLSLFLPLLVDSFQKEQLYPKIESIDTFDIDS